MQRCARHVVARGAPAANFRCFVFSSKERSRTPGAREAITLHIPPWYGKKDRINPNTVLAPSHHGADGIEVLSACSAPQSRKPLLS